MTIEEARKFAANAHGSQMYGSERYVFHLDQVYKVLSDFIDDADLHISAYLHDIIEDTHVSKRELRTVFGDRVADIVWAVSDGEGASRRERKAIAYKKIQSLGDDAIAIKLADRIANVSNSRAHNSRIYSMYKREQDSFRSALFMDGSRSEVIQMWNHLDSLFSEI